MTTGTGHGMERALGMAIVHDEPVARRGVRRLLVSTHERPRAHCGADVSFTLRVDPGGNGSVAGVLLPVTG